MKTPTLWPSGHRYANSAMLKGEREAWELGFKAGQDDAARQIREAINAPDTHPDLELTEDGQ
jgi:hypothetical protein